MQNYQVCNGKQGFEYANTIRCPQSSLKRKTNKSSLVNSEKLFEGEDVFTTVFGIIFVSCIIFLLIVTM